MYKKNVSCEAVKVLTKKIDELISAFATQNCAVLEDPFL